MIVVLAIAAERAVADLHRIRAARHLDDRGEVSVGVIRQNGTPGREVTRKALRVDRCRRDDDFEVGAPRKEAREIAEKHVDVEGALVRLVDDEGVVGEEVWVALDLGEQDAVRHHLDKSVILRLIDESHLVTNDIAEFGAEFFGDALRNRAGGDAARLGVADLARAPPAKL